MTNSPTFLHACRMFTTTLALFTGALAIHPATHGSVYDHERADRLADVYQADQDTERLVVQHLAKHVARVYTVRDGSVRFLPVDLVDRSVRTGLVYRLGRGRKITIQTDAFGNSVAMVDLEFGTKPRAYRRLSHEEVNWKALFDLLERGRIPVSQYQDWKLRYFELPILGSRTVVETDQGLFVFKGRRRPVFVGKVDADPRASRSWESTCPSPNSRVSTAALTKTGDSPCASPRARRTSRGDRRPS